jgi:dTDP-4-dehydrorhamnose reductase|tara:strand:+ start:348 stop:1232 length:885 start_codon:yes stop_codon:yes gene_type:complete
MSRILVTGKNGQLGKSIEKLTANTEQTEEFIFVGRDVLDLCDENKMIRYFKDNIFDIIINCAAYTQVDKAEEEPELANQINHLAVSQLAQIAKNQQAKLIHISTDYVFDGQNGNPRLEIDKTNPINVYGKTKLAGEKAIQKIMPTNATIIRVSWMYSEYGNNFVKTMLRVAKEKDEINVVSDRIGSPTYATDLAEVILQAIKNRTLKKENQITNIYHYSNEGEISWYEFAREIFKFAKIDCKVNPIVSEHYPTLAQRPKIVLMNKSKISHKFDINILELRKSLESCIATLKKQQ